MENAGPQKAFEQFAVVEIFGHQRIAGKITEQTIGGCSFVRVDVPALPERTVSNYGREQKVPPIAGFTKLYGQGAIYAMTFVDEAIANATAATLRVMPIDAYTLQDALKSATLEVRPALARPSPDDDDQDR